MQRRASVPILLFAFLILSPTTHAVQISCPENTILTGSAPPDGTQMGCLNLDGEREGPFKSWYKDGGLEAEGFFKQDQMEGPYRSFHPNGKLKSEGTFSRGKPTGLWRRYTSEGQIKDEGEWTDGKPTGLWKVREADGTMSEKKFGLDSFDRGFEWLHFRAMAVQGFQVERGGRTTTFELAYIPRFRLFKAWEVGGRLSTSLFRNQVSGGVIWVLEYGPESRILLGPIYWDLGAGAVNWTSGDRPLTFGAWSHLGVRFRKPILKWIEGFSAGGAFHAFESESAYLVKVGVDFGF